MAEAHKDFLFVLIKSLSKSEKRQFKVYVNRLGINADAKFLLLFDVLDKSKFYDESKIIERKITTKQQLSNLKAHLYRQILVSLRTNPSNQNNKITIREQLNFATILYNKGLYKQSLKILDKTKQFALSLEEKDIAYEIVELEKVIESQFITRSSNSRADELIEDAKNLSEKNALNSKLSNLSLKLYNLMLSNGYAKNENEKLHIEKYFEENLPVNTIQMGFREKLWFFKAHVWKYLLIQDFVHAYEFSLKWVKLFYEHPEMIENHPVWFIKGNNYLLNALFILRKRKRFDIWLNKLETTILSDDFPKNENIEAIVFTNLYKAKINSLFLHGDYINSNEVIRKIKAHKEFHDHKIDDHHILILNYKIASTYFGNQDYKKCLKVLDNIINHKNTSVREDLYFNSRILSIMTMIDSGFDENLDEFIDETKTFYKKMKNTTRFHDLVIKLFSEKHYSYPNDQKKIFKKFLEEFKMLMKNNYFMRNLVYLDIISWLEAKLSNRNISEVIKEKSI